MKKILLGVVAFVFCSFLYSMQSSTPEDLYSAITSKNREEVKRIITTLDINKVFYQDNVTPFQLALRTSTDAISMLLLEKTSPANINHKDNAGMVALSIALYNKKLAIATILIDKGADVKTQNNNGWSSLMYAARIGFDDICKTLIEKGVDINLQKADGYNALMLALLNKHPGIARMLIEENADLNKQATHGDDDTPSGSTALTIALLLGLTPIAILLVKKGAAVNTVDSLGWTPFILAVRNGSYDLCELLIEKGADINIQKKNSLSALMLAVINNRVDIVKLLIENSVHLNTQTAFVIDVSVNEDGRYVHAGSTALMFAITLQYIEIVELLINAGARVDLKNNAGQTGVELAKITNNERIIQLVEAALKPKEEPVLQSRSDFLVKTLEDLAGNLSRLEKKLDQN